MNKFSQQQFSKIPRRSQRYFRPGMTEKKIGLFFRIDEEKCQNYPHILDTNDILEFMKQKQIETYSVNGIEFTFNLTVVKFEEIQKMFQVIKVFQDTVEEITIKVTHAIDESATFDDQLVDDMQLKKQLSLNFDWKSITKIGQNEKVLSFLNLFKRISSEENIQKLNIHFAQIKSNPDKINNIIDIATSLPKVEELKITFTNYIHSDAFQSLGSLNKKEQQISMKRLEFDFTNTSLSKNGSQYLSNFLSGCENLESLKLNLRYNKLDDQDLIQILQSIEKKQFIQNLQLSLSSNCFKVEGSNYIVKFLNEFASLSQLKVLGLDLRMFEILNEDISLNLFGTFKNLTHLNQLFLNLQRIKMPQLKECLLQFSQSLGQMSQLKQLNLDLSWSEIKNEITPLFTQIGNLTQLTSLQLSLIGIPFGERKMKMLENSIQQLKSLQMLNLNMDLRNTYRGNHQIYQDLIQIIERELTPLMNFELTELDKISSNYYIDVHEMYNRVQQKIFLRKQLIYSIVLLKKLFMIGKIKRKEMIEDFANFLMQPKYFREKSSFVPPAPEILDLIN
ncbi:hypothetical protein TTHERM_00149200 (macronuclear) [Tetrahymena thermophila SB210]|uniref:Kinase domain protein n=1 Tax=Tetrahymena thermophila (strain SB210) TaxID=312017 RepID=I7M9C2_TETTS|nr:hypothetical protein TTHERM_00149200 [Tetrahymena thermophila SB210]EAS01310.2 hypothetical protein TTHERM_00149200 [Tetrahymena thermophila SB210]|eukprot:XP_001021555.2 hypothetical protein TTHERM_00149200 [Tetrahymena thermophila SB210]